MIIQAKHPNRPVKLGMISRGITLTFLVIALTAFTVVWTSGNGVAGTLTKEVCEADYKDLLVTIEHNRIAGVDQINEHLAGVTDEKERDRLMEMREKTWDSEEEQRAMAGNIRRDCLTAVK
jgi:hypothetical protein